MDKGKPEKNRLPLELKHCTFEIHRKEQDLTPLLNTVRNSVITEWHEWIDKADIPEIIHKNIYVSKFVANKLANAIRKLLKGK